MTLVVLQVWLSLFLVNVMNNVSIDNVTVIADMIAEYEESGKEANAGAM